MQDIPCQETDQILLNTKEINYGIPHVSKKVSPLYVFEDKDAIRESQYSTKIKYILLIHSPAELIFIKKSDSLAKTTKDIAILLRAHKQQSFGSPKTPVQHFN